MIKSVKTKRAIVSTAGHTFLTVLSFVWLLPIIWLVLQSFRGGYGGPTSNIIPTEWTFDNYTKLFTNTTLFNFPRWFANTLFIAVVSCIISTITVLMTSYAFSRLRFKMREKYMKIILVIGMFPGFMSMIAIYHVLKFIGLTQSLWALILVYSAGAAMGYYVSKGFFDTIPKAIDESAMIDGATKSQIFWKITLPMSKPIVIYTILTAYMAPWVDFVFASIIMRDNYSNFTMAIGLYEMLRRENIGTYFTQFCAGAVLVAIPITILFIYMQKFYVSGITGGSVKG